MTRFWVYVGDKVQGPVDIPSLRKIPGFNLLTQVCPEGAEIWKMADEVIEIKSYFLSPPRPNSFAMPAGNTAPKLDFPPMPEPVLNRMPKTELEELTLPEPSMAWQNGDAAPKAEAPAGQPANALRNICEVCGYKNPRDVLVCMKCGEKLAPASSPKAIVGDSSKDKPLVNVTPALTPSPSPAPARAAAPAADSAPNNATVEISMGKLAAMIGIAALVSGGSFFGIRSWKKHHIKAPALHIVAPSAAKPVLTAKKTHGRMVTRHTRAPAVTPAPSDDGQPEVTALPGISDKRPVRQTKTAPIGTEQASPESYRVVSEATPLRKRFSSPINSPYATKRRADQTLWNSQEGQAIRQVQQNRIYGGQRTINRNAEVLMQILRDREYTSAFETGKRIYLYNDMDWSAVMKEGPVYEVHLTFSGGREADGSAKKPLHFAFNSDLERGTVEPGGQDQIRSNTLHAYFDESRIPPEDRRAIARDTEEVVLAAQPGGSPLALDTVVRQFAKVYTTAALIRIADAYDLSLVKKRLEHDPQLGSEEPIQGSPASVSPLTKKVTSVVQAATAKPSEPKPMVSAFTLPKGAEPEYRMERGAGRERTFSIRAATKASPSRVWEVLTGYDRLKQFMPDMVASEREGQDGAAIIVHTVCLTRFAFFVFKMNLHLRVIEHPREHTLEFERIAGEFESLRGAVQVMTDPTTHDTLIDYRATIVPSGHAMSWVLESMGRRLLVGQIAAIRAKAESN